MYAISLFIISGTVGSRLCPLLPESIDKGCVEVLKIERMLSRENKRKGETLLGFVN